MLKIKLNKAWLREYSPLPPPPPPLRVPMIGRLFGGGGHPKGSSELAVRFCRVHFYFTKGVVRLWGVHFSALQGFTRGFMGVWMLFLMAKGSGFLGFRAGLGFGVQVHGA